jgi:hypothetical protein
VPWTVDDPPTVAKNWTAEEQKKCVAAANAVLKEGGTDEEAIYACIHAAGKGRCGMNSALQKLWAQVRRAFEAADKELPPDDDVERALSWGDIWSQTAQALDADPELGPMWPWINDMYQEEDRTVALVSAGGKLYRVPVMVNGADVEIGTAEQVEVTFTPARERAFTIIRQADGTSRWFAITETAVLLRVGEIDSKALFDSFIAHAEASGEYPTLRFYHDERIEFGRADWLAREGNCYLASGTFDEEHPVAQAFIDASEKGRGTWGTSNGFVPTSEPEMLEVAEGVTIPVYTAGVHREISILLEPDAASWFTTITAKGVTRMRDKVKEALETLFGDPNAASEFIEQVDRTNREIEERGLITRDNEPAPAEDNPSDGADTTEETTEEIRAADEEITVDDAAIERIAAHVVSRFTAQIDELRAMIEGLPKPEPVDLTPVREAIDALSVRLTALERTDDEKKREWMADLPARTRTKVSYRPSVTPAAPAASPAAKPMDSEQVAQATLAALPPR